MNGFIGWFLSVSKNLLVREHPWLPLMRELSP